MNTICGDVMCPFFTTETNKTINCEGVENGVKNSLRFEDRELKLDYMKRYCLKYPNECLICKAAKEKYE